MAPDLYDLEFVRKSSFNYTHWELHQVNLRTGARKVFLIDGFPMNYVYVEKNQLGEQLSDAMISHDFICKMSQEQAGTLARVAAATPIHRTTKEEYRRLISEGKKPYGCQQWTVQVLASLEAEGVVPSGVSNKLGKHVGDKGTLLDDRTWSLS